MTVIIYNYRANKENKPTLNKSNKQDKVPKSTGKGTKNDKNVSKSKNKKEGTWKERTIKKSSEVNRKERIDDLHKCARWLPDSAYQSYFGRPAFHTYGMKNTTPTYGGHVYGDYMLTHNVNPEHGQNKPKYQQVYHPAMNKGFTQGDRVPVLTRKGRDNLEISETNMKELNQRLPTMPKKFKNPEPEDKYSEVPESEYDFTHLKKKNKNNVEFHPAHDENEDNEEEEDPEAEEMQHIAQVEEGAQAYPEDRNQQMPIPEPGTLEYKRMLEQFLNNPEYIKTLMQEGGDLQNMFPFCSVHNSYGQQLPTHELDPKNYKFLPAKYTSRIVPAGRQTSKSENLYNVIL